MVLGGQLVTRLSAPPDWSPLSKDGWRVPPWVLDQGQSLPPAHVRRMLLNEDDDDKLQLLTSYLGTRH